MITKHRQKCRTEAATVVLAAAAAAVEDMEARVEDIPTGTTIIQTALLADTQELATTLQPIPPGMTIQVWTLKSKFALCIILLANPSLLCGNPSFNHYFILCSLSRSC